MQVLTACPFYLRAVLVLDGKFIAGSLRYFCGKTFSIIPAADVCQRTALGSRSITVAFRATREKIMKRSLILSSVLAASIAVVGAACETKPEAPNKPVSTPVPVAPASPMTPPVAAPTASPVASPGKPGATPEVKKPDEKNVNKDAKPATVATPKTN
ncbi:hypothetical protein BH10ACI2_BH10ACI2_08130 [soil metagenome]